MKFLTTFSIVLLSVLGIHAQGLIWSVNQSAGNNIAAPGGSWQILFANASGGSPVSTIFSMNLVTNDTGRTFFANTLNESEFGGFAAGLTDGVNGLFRFQQGSLGTFQDRSEQGFLGRSALAPDLAGSTITQIGFRVNNFYDYFDVQENGYFRQLDYSLDFYGAAVPEPGTWALLGLGSALLWSATRRRRK